MDYLTPSVGKLAEGDGYFHREKVVKKIRRKLSHGENVLISAPRRIGKSSILKYLKNNPQEGEVIKYLIVQSVDSSEAFFRQLYIKLIKDDRVFKGMQGYIRRATNPVKHFIKRIQGVNLAGVKFSSHRSIDYYQECFELIQSFKNQKVIIFIDEFPDAVDNIRRISPKLAIHFLQQNREMRLEFSEANLQFVYTGSTGLRNIVRKLDKLDLINDLSEFNLPTFSKIEAKILIQRLLLYYQSEEPHFSLTDQQIDYILQIITWRLPFYFQMIIESLFEYYEDTNKAITIASIKQLFKDMVKAKSNHADYFENWQRRLKDDFEKKEYHLCLAILNEIALKNRITYQYIKKLAQQQQVNDFKYVIDVLEYDGYINETQRQYCFNSFLLQQWWLINVAT